MTYALALWDNYDDYYALAISGPTLDVARALCGYYGREDQSLSAARDYFAECPNLIVKVTGKGDNEGMIALSVQRDKLTVHYLMEREIEVKDWPCLTFDSLTRFLAPYQIGFDGKI